MELLTSESARREEEKYYMEHSERTWIIIRTFNRHERVLSEFLKNEGLTCFVPMHYKERINDKDAKPKKVLVPIVHDYVFLQKTILQESLDTLLAKCKTPLYLLKSKDTDHPFEISNREMVEFRMLCDPDFERQVMIKKTLDDVKIGKEVVIVNGPFKGIRGRLYRKQKHYWFVKAVAGLTVELRITRWFCKPV